MRLPQIAPTPEFWDEFFKEPLADVGDLDVVRFISEDRDEYDEDMARRYRMKTVSVKQLQNDLSRYLDEVRAGKEVVIEERNNPVAKIIPFSADDEDDAYLMKLAAEGRARLPIEEGPIPPEFWEEPPFNVSAKELVALVSEDRDED